jgi:phosphoribosylformylglycinamidine (FGAM) synthase-like enzyme
VIAFDDETAVCFKVETHNHPSAIEPYGGAATGIGGVIRDIIGTGLAPSRSRARTSSASHPPTLASLEALPAGCLHPQADPAQVVAACATTATAWASHRQRRGVVRRRLRRQPAGVLRLRRR